MMSVSDKDSADERYGSCDQQEDGSVSEGHVVTCEHCESEVQRQPAELYCAHVVCQSCHQDTAPNNAEKAVCPVCKRKTLDFFESLKKDDSALRKSWQTRDVMTRDHQTSRAGDLQSPLSWPRCPNTWLSVNENTWDDQLHPDAKRLLISLDVTSSSNQLTSTTPTNEMVCTTPIKELSSSMRANQMSSDTPTNERASSIPHVTTSDGSCYCIVCLEARRRLQGQSDLIQKSPPVTSSEDKSDKSYAAVAGGMTSQKKSVVISLTETLNNVAITSSSPAGRRWALPPPLTSPGDTLSRLATAGGILPPPPGLTVTSSPPAAAGPPPGAVTSSADSHVTHTVNTHLPPAQAVTSPAVGAGAHLLKSLPVRVTSAGGGQSHGGWCPPGVAPDLLVRLRMGVPSRLTAIETRRGQLRMRHEQFLRTHAQAEQALRDRLRDMQQALQQNFNDIQDELRALRVSRDARLQEDLARLDTQAQVLCAVRDHAQAPLTSSQMTSLPAGVMEDIRGKLNENDMLERSFLQSVTSQEKIYFHVSKQAAKLTKELSLGFMEVRPPALQAVHYVTRDFNQGVIQDMAIVSDMFYMSIRDSYESDNAGVRLYRCDVSALEVGDGVCISQASNKEAGAAVRLASLGERIWVSDTRNSAVNELNPMGRFVEAFGQLEFWWPTGLAVSPDGQYMVVADQGGSCLHRYTIQNACDAGKLTDRDVAFKRPWYLAINHRNDVIVSDEKAAQIIVIYNFSPNRVRRYRRKESGVGALVRPAGVAVDSFGNILVCDEGSDSVLVLTYEAKFRQYLLTSHDGLRRPLAILLDEGTQRLYIGQADGVLKTFKYTASH